MKKLLLGILAISLSFNSWCQTDPVSSMFEKYSGLEGITTVNITGDMLKLITQAEQENRDTVFSSKLSEIKVISVGKKCDKPANIDFRSEVLDKLDKSSYKEMMTVKKGGDDIVFFMKERNGRIAEIIIVAAGDNNNALIQVKGDILLSELDQLGRKYNIKGLEQLKKLEH